VFIQHKRSEAVIAFIENNRKFIAKRLYTLKTRNLQITPFAIDLFALPFLLTRVARNRLAPSLT